MQAYVMTVMSTQWTFQLCHSLQILVLQFVQGALEALNLVCKKVPPIKKDVHASEYCTVFVLNGNKISLY